MPYRPVAIVTAMLQGCWNLIKKNKFILSPRATVNGKVEACELQESSYMLKIKYTNSD